jgi:hypothetical protein
MKKRIIRLLIALVVLVILAAVAAGLFLDKAIKKGVESFGPKLTKVDIKLESVSVSLFSGSGSIKGLVVGNPEGFKTPCAIRVGTASLVLKPSSLLADKIIIKAIEVQGPEITYETDLKQNNLSKILSNVQETTGGGKEPAKPTEPAPPKQAKPAKKLELDDFTISGGRIHVSWTALGGESLTVPLPTIHLQDLGKGSAGLTPEELTQIVLEKIKNEVVQAAAGAVADIGKGGLYITRDGGGAGSNAVEKVTKGIGGVLKKK